MEALMIRGVLEVHTDFTRQNVMIMEPQVLDFTVRGDKLWLHTEHGLLVSMAEYRSELLCTSAFLGYSAVFLLETEDAVTQVRLSDLRLKHRCGIVKADNLLHFALCTVISCVENCNLTRKCLHDLLQYLDAVNVRESFGRLLHHSARQLICSALYLLFEEKEPHIVQYVPATFVLFQQTRHTCLQLVARFFFRLTGQDEAHSFSLKLTERKTVDGWPVGLGLLDVLNANYPNLPSPPKLPPRWERGEEE
ncbi:tegument protein UL7 [Human betaherpesvirus 5]|uniref:Tegument protein UL7 n=1 Tax=Human cytomegalovirus TaxID=10359 RepID=V9PTD3_HCMV|nr:tegument protein UL7 [Human betaherpesvirus 5]